MDENMKEVVAVKRRLRPSDLWTLMKSPVAFFGGDINLTAKPLLVTVVMIAGMSNAIDRIDSELMQYGAGQELNSIVDLVVSYGWISFWIYALLFGALSAGIAWLINGWWYGKRLEWCVDRELTVEDKMIGRLSFFYNQLIPSMLSVLIAVSYTFTKGDYIEAFFEMGLIESFASFMVLILMVVSVVNSHRTVRGLFPVKKWKERIWFLFLPMIVYLVAILGAFSLFMG